MAERLGLPNSVVRQANTVANQLLPNWKAHSITIPAISAYSLLYASRSAGIAYVTHRHILAAYADAGHEVTQSHLLRIGFESSTHLPRASVEELIRVSLGRLRSSRRMAIQLRKADQSRDAYFTRLFKLAKEIAARTRSVAGFSPRTVAAGSVYLASLAVVAKKILTQREAAETLGMAEYTVREFLGRVRNDETNVALGPLPGRRQTRLRKTIHHHKLKDRLPGKTLLP